MRPLPFVPVTDRPAVIAPLSPADAGDIGNLAARAAAAGADAVEWRLDALPALASEPGSLSPVAHSGDAAGAPAGIDAALSRAADGLAAIAASTAALPVLATVRTRAEGGTADLGAAYYAQLITELIRLRPAAVDVEFRRREAGELLSAANASGVCALASFHDFAATPGADELVELGEKMERAGAAVAKFAVMPHTHTDVLAVLDACERLQQRVRIPVIGIAMGAVGRSSRLIGGDFGSAATFAAVAGASAPGQLSVEQVRTVLGVLARPAD